MTAKSINNEISKQLFEALEKIDKLEKKQEQTYNVIDDLKRDFSRKEKKYKKEIASLKAENKQLKKIIEKKDNEINDLKGEILRLRTNNQKDSTNSSKPSSTNGYKKVITNRRQKSNNKPGKPTGSSSTNLSQEKLNKFLNSGNVEYNVVEINKNNKNKNMKYMVYKVMDIKIVKTVTEYRVYPNEDGTYNMVENYNRAIQYGNNLKTICTYLNNNIYNSTDAIVTFISDITNNGVNLSKSTLLRWNHEIAIALKPEIENIEKSLIESYYLNCDDSSIKINGEGYNDLCVCNKKYTRLWISEKKDRKSWKQYTILPNFKGIIVKDGTDVFNGLGIFLAQCVSHVLRYIKGIYDFVKHKGPKRLEKLIQKYIHLRNKKIEKKIEGFTENELKIFWDKFFLIFNEWKHEWMKSDKKNNPVYEEERKLLSRFEDEQEREQIFYFMYDFKVSATNSQAEVDQRGAKIKQKIGKFRSVAGADDYAVIKSCTSTYKKNSKSVFDALVSAFENKTIII